jgi:cytochrome c oxidase assembly factor CtaG
MISVVLPVRQGIRWWLAGVVAIPTAIVVVVVAAEGQATYQLVSASFPGAWTANLSALLQLVALVASTVCIGAVTYSLFVKRRVGRDRMMLDYASDLKIVRRSSLVWLCAAICLVPVDAADSSGLTIERLLTPGALPYLVEATYLPRAWIAVVICAGAAFAVSMTANKWTSLAFVLGVSVIGVLAPVIVNQVLVGPNHDFGGDAAIIGTPGMAVLFGVLLVFVFRLVSGKGIASSSTARFFRVTAVGWVVVVVTTAIVCMFELAGGGLFATATGDLFALRFFLLLVIGASVWRAWRVRGNGRGVSMQVIPWLVTASLAAVASLGVVEGMTKIAPPVYFVPTSVSQVFLGYNVVAAPTAWVLALDWRINILFLALGAAGIGLYWFGYLRLRRRGDAWPLGRTVSWTLGWLVIVSVTSSGIGRYSTAQFSTHMILHMSLNMLGPILLVMGGPITLALRVAPAHKPSEPAGLHEWINAVMGWPFLRHLYNPLFVWIEFVGSYWLLYFTNIFNLALRYHWAHQLLDLQFVFIGYLFYGLVIGVDKPPRSLPHIGKLGLVFAAMPFHAFFGVIVMSQSTIIAKQFYNYLDLPWMTNLKSDQYLGGGIAWAAGELPLIVVIIALVTQWAKQDARLAKRTDRHLDSGIDDSFEAYNAMLSGLANRREAPLGAYRRGDEARDGTARNSSD